MIKFIRVKIKLVCLICFLLTSGAGALGIIKPGLVDLLVGSTIDITPQNAFFAYATCLMITIVGFWFLIIMMDPDGQKPLLGLAVAEKLIFVGFFIYALGPLKLSWMFIPIILGDLTMGAALLVYLILGPEKEQGVKSGV